MARPLRIEFDGAVYHLTSRGNGGDTVFRTDLDRKSFLDTLSHVTQGFNWVCHAYCLMGNHYHLLVETPDGNLSTGMRQLNGVFTQSFNKRHKRSGHVFQGRFKSIVIEKESHLLEVCRYVVLNPVRAGIVKKPENWRWSSYGATVGLVDVPSCLTTDWVLGQFSSRRATARRKYREFVYAGIRDHALWGNLKGGVVLGTEGFASDLSEMVRGRTELREIPKQQRYLNRAGLAELFGDETLLGRVARNAKIREAVRKHGYSQKEVSDHLSLHCSVVSRILKAGDDINARNKT